jgi:hypothetical protein
MLTSKKKKDFNMIMISCKTYSEAGRIHIYPVLLKETGWADGDATLSGKACNTGLSTYEPEW